MDTFKPSKSLLNPKFEGYKLDPICQDDIVTRFPLQFKPTQATVSGRSPFSFQEVQSRITHNHLAVSSEAGRALYVDSANKVVLIDVDAETLSPSFRVIYELPTYVQSNDVQSPHYEYPSAAFVSPTVVLVSDGHGLLYALRIADNAPSDAHDIFSLPETSSPFRIHTVHRTSSTTVTAILSSRHYEAKPEPNIPIKDRKSVSTDFDVWCVRVALSEDPIHTMQQLDVLWHRHGPDVPIYTAYSEDLKSFLLIGGASYQEIGHVPLPSYEPSPDEMAPIPRADEKLDNSAEPPKPPPYSWTQTSESVTVAIPLPSSTPKSKIMVLFSPQTLTVHIDSEITSVPIPRYSAKKLWDGISASSSYWTWDREAEHSFGLLTLYLDKQHEGTKWAHIFTPTGGSEEEVLEILDPSELWHVREALEKYTTALRDGDDASGLGLGRGVPSLAEGELDMEVDEIVGRVACLSWVSEDGSTPSWWKNSEETPFQLLSTPIPGHADANLSLVVKNNLDGTVFRVEIRESGSPTWSHISTFSALAFVLASKRDTRFTFHTSKSVYAFEGGARDRGGNVYIYRSTSPSSNWAKQAILKVDDGYGGSLLGVGALQFRGTKPVLFCLTEGEIILIRDS